ncbi:MAG: c-type cytochrome domain-containing protein [Chitinophagaceae bacterium]
MSEFIGRFHPVLVHLPIGILLLACFFQLLSAKEKYAGIRPAIGIMLFWGMLSAIASCISGYLLSGSGEYDADLVGKHQWLGISVAAVAVIYYWLYQRKTIIKYRRAFPVLLIILITVTGHLGGSLTHGSDYLTGSFKSLVDTVVIKKPIPNVQEAVAYTDIIQPLLQSKCYSCHGANKQKGKLRMDQTDLLLKGGKDGIIIEPGKAAVSEMIKRILLEKADEHHMPPKEKPQLSEKEIALLHWWIASGASFDKKTKDLAQTEQIKPVLLSLQNEVAEKKAIAAVPATPVEKADEAAIKKLKDSGVVVMPVAAGSNYLMLSFVAAATATNETIQLILPLKKQVIWLKLNSTKITDAAMKTVAQCSNLRRLELANTGITDAGLSNLANLQQLQSLTLVATKITAAGLLQLKNLKQLQGIYFYQSAVKNTDWDMLTKNFPTVKLDSGGYQVPLFATDTMLVQPPKRPDVK